MLDELRERIRSFNSEREWERFHSPKNLSISILIEAAELAEVFQWLSEDESVTPGEDSVERASLEIADVLIYLLNISDKLGIDPIEAAFLKLRLNEEKYPVQLSRGNSLKYDRLERGDEER